MTRFFRGLLGLRDPKGVRVYTSEHSGVYFTHDSDAQLLRVYRTLNDELIDSHRLTPDCDPMAVADDLQWSYDYDRS